MIIKKNHKFTFRLAMLYYDIRKVAEVYLARIVSYKS